jgi:NADPH:quinone reductase-like Zn-dependent oxidoreductase
MRAVRLHGHGGTEMLRLEDAPLPRAGDREVLVRVSFCGLNHSDLNLRRGTYYGLGTDAGQVGWRQTPLRFPLIPGSDVAGVVAQAGSQVSGLPEGDRVVLYPYVACGACIECRRGNDHLCPNVEYLGSERDGGYAEFIAVPARIAYPVPPGVALEEAAALPVNYLTAWHMMVTRGSLQPGETVMVTGASGGVGSACVQIARLMGARALAVVGSREKALRVLESGADAAVVPGQDDLLDAIHQWAGRGGVDMVVELVGAATWSSSLGALRPEGRVVVCGAVSGSVVETDLKRIYLNHLSVIGSTMGSPAEFERVLDLLASGAIRPIIDRIYPLEQAAEAQRRLENREQIGKVLLRVTDPEGAKHRQRAPQSSTHPEMTWGTPVSPPRHFAKALSRSETGVISGKGRLMLPGTGPKTPQELVGVPLGLRPLASRTKQGMASQTGA